MNKINIFKFAAFILVLSVFLSACRKEITTNKIQSSTEPDVESVSTCEVTDNNNIKVDMDDTAVVIDDIQSVTFNQEIQSSVNDVPETTKEPEMESSNKNKEEQLATYGTLHDVIESKINVYSDCDFIYSFIDSATDERTELQIIDNTIFNDTLRKINILNFEENVKISSGFKDWIALKYNNDTVLKITGLEKSIIVSVAGTQTKITCDINAFNILKSTICDNS